MQTLGTLLSASKRKHGWPCRVALLAISVWSAAGCGGESLNDGDREANVDSESALLVPWEASSGDPGHAASEGERASAWPDPDHHPKSPRNPLSSYETDLPHKTQPDLPIVERILLVDYLNHPKRAELARLLADYHLGKSLLNGRGGEGLRHSILALYFLNRAKDLGIRSALLQRSLDRTNAALARLFENGSVITSDENHDAHLFYRRTFHFNQEQNRYEALARLLQDFSEQPRNVYTSFAITALNLWMGGEANYDDPTTLYNFVLGSYFSLHTITLAHTLETAWNADPVHTTRFRMAATLGGFSLLQRRWLAIVHGDQAAVQLIDDEHRAWYKIQPAFHSFPLGLPFFDEPENFDEGYAVYLSGIPACSMIPVRTCSDLPRFQFNLLGFVLGIVDYSLKAGDIETARAYLNFRHDPSQAETWSHWSIGREAWTHREQNLEAIAKLYANDNPLDDPTNFEMKRRKWGENTTTCQECHQIQAFPDSWELVNQPQILPPPETASVRNWPPVTTAWYGASLR